MATSIGSGEHCTGTVRAEAGGVHECQGCYRPRLGMVGAVMLRQWPHGLEIVGLALVSAAIALTGQARRPPEAVADEVPPV